MEDQQTTRRDLLRAAGAAAAGWTIVRPEAARGYPANSRIKVGLLGAGRRGTRVSGFLAAGPETELAAIADIYDDQIEQAKKSLDAADAAAYKSAAALLDSDIDAVLIATPPHLHPEHFEMAVESGKHIFMEKPIGVDPAGVKRVLAAAKKLNPGQVVVVDFQQRFGKDYREAYRRVADGEIGPIGMVRSAWLGSGLPRRSGHPESEEKIRNWLFYSDYSGDIIVEQNCHNMDVVHWFLGGVHPVSAMGYAHRAFRTDIGDIVDSFGVTYKLPDGRVYSHEGAQINPRGGFSDVGEYFMGREGTIHTSRGGYEVFLGGQDPVVKKTTYNITEDAANGFIEAVRGKVPPPDMIVSSCESTLTAIMGRIAYQQEREVTWDELLAM